MAGTWRQLNAHASLMPRFDQAFTAVVEDLDERGMLDHVLVIAMSEFGRTPRINGHIGRDHWPEAWSIAMTGTGIKQGAIIGSTNDDGTWSPVNLMTSDTFSILGLMP